MGHTPSHPRILLVDSERAFKAALATALRRDGYEVLLADHADQAIELSSHTPLDLVVTELRLAGTDGLDLLRRLRERSARDGRTPAPAAIVVTAYGSLESAVDAMRLGAADYVTKPVQVASLRRVVARVLADRPRTPRTASPFRLADVAHDLLAAPGEAHWVHDLWHAGAGRRGILLAAEPAAGRDVLRALVRAEAAHHDKPRSVLASVETTLGTELTAFIGVLDVAARVLRFAATGPLEAWLCGAGFANDVLTGRHDDIGVAIEPPDRLVVASAGAQAADADTPLDHATTLRAGAALRVDIGSLVRTVAEETLTLRPPCSADDYVERTEDVAGRAGLEPDDAFRVATAVAEAVQNAERHAYDDPAAGLIEVRYLQTPNDLMVQVTDNGRGFDTADADPVVVGATDLYRESGRGFLMMRQLMDAVDVHSASGRGTTVRMEKGRHRGNR